MIKESNITLQGSSTFTGTAKKIASGFVDSVFKAGPLIARWKASGSVVNDAGRVQRVPDHSGSEMDLVPSGTGPSLIDDHLEFKNGSVLATSQDFDIVGKPFTYFVLVRVDEHGPVPLLRIGALDSGWSQNSLRILLDFTNTSDKYRVHVLSNGDPRDPSSVAQTRFLGNIIDEESRWYLIQTTLGDERSSKTSFRRNNQRLDPSNLVHSNMLLDRAGPLAIGLYQNGTGRGTGSHSIREMLIYEGVLGDDSLDTIWNYFDQQYDLVTINARASLQAISDMDPVAIARFIMVQGLEGSSGLDPLVERRMSGFGDIQGLGSIETEETRLREADASLEGLSGIITSAFLTAWVQTHLDSDSDLIAKGVANFLGQSSLESSTSLTAMGSGQYPRNVSFTSEGMLTVEALKAAIRSASLEGLGSLDSLELRQRGSSTSVEGLGSLDSLEHFIGSPTVHFDGSGSLLGLPSGKFVRSSSLEGLGSLETEETRGRWGQAELDSISSFEGLGGLRFNQEETLNSSSEFTGSASLLEFFYASSGHNVVKYSKPGSLVWTFTNPTNVLKAVATDPDGFVYAGANNGRVYKISRAGSQVWLNTDEIYIVNCISVDPDGFVYVGHSYQGRIRKLDSSGSVVWTRDLPVGDQVNSLATDHAGNIYAQSTTHSTHRLYRLDSDGEIVWDIPYNKVNKIALDRKGFLYTCTNSRALTKLRPDGTYVYTSTLLGLDSNSSITTLALDPAGNIYIGVGNPAPEFRRLVKLNPSRTFLWDVPVGSLGIDGVSLDPDGKVVYYFNGNNVLRRDTVTGDLIGTHSTGSTVGALAVDPGVLASFPEAWGFFFAKASMQGSSTFTGLGKFFKSLEAELSAAGALDNISSLIARPTTEVLGSGTLTGLTEARLGASSSLVALGSVSSLETRVRDADASLEGSSLVESSYQRTRSGSGTLDAVSSLIGSGATTFGSSLTLEGSSSLNSESLRVIPGSSSLEGSSTFVGDAELVAGAPPERFVYSGSQDATVRKISSTGTQIWSFTGVASVIRAVAVDKDGNVYAGSNSGVRKISSTGTLIWTFTGHTATVQGVAVDKDGNVYTASTDNTVRKLNSSGVQQWSFTGHTAQVRDVAVDSEGNAYTVSDDHTVRKISSTGTQIWSFTGHTATTDSVAVDSEGNVYSSGYDHTVRKISSTGTQIWSFTGHTATVRSVAVDKDGNVYSGSQDNTVRKISPTGTQIWSYGIPGNSLAVSVDPEGYVYVGIVTVMQVRKLDPDGVLVWTFSGHTHNILDVAVDPGTSGAFPTEW